MTRRVLVTGATGTVGSRVLDALAARGVAARALVRDPARARARLGGRPELAVGDFADRRSLRRALDGVEAMFLACGSHPRQLAWESGGIDAAEAAGVRRIVKLSIVGAEVGAPVAFWDVHGRVEARLRAGAVPAVVLRPAFLMTNLFAAIGTVRSAGRLFAPAADARIAMVDPRDVAAAAAVALVDPKHEGRTYTLTGPTSVTYTGLAEAMTAVVRRTVEFVDVTDETARRALLAAGLQPWFAESSVRAFGEMRRGAYERTSNDLVTLTGQAPRDVAAFLRDHVMLFAGPGGGSRAVA